MQRMYENMNCAKTDNFSQNEKCMCNKSILSSLPNCYSVAMAYIPFQTDTEMYDELKALCAGTLFPCLDKPFLGSGCR